MARLFIGTAGWSVPTVHRGAFPDEGSHVERYGAVFQGVEINSSFYRSHRRSTYERWAASVPSGFRFAVKVPKAITHAGLLDTGPDLDRFLSEIAGLGEKLGPLLIQMPPKQAFSDEGAAFLGMVRTKVAGAVVCEPRHASWFEAHVDALLCELRIARVAADPPPVPAAAVPGGWPGLIYRRLHGSPVIYRSSYDDMMLEDLADGLAAASRSGVEAWCIFDNTTSYAAAGNALTTQRMAGERLALRGSAALRASSSSKGSAAPRRD